MQHGEQVGPCMQRQTRVVVKGQGFLIHLLDLPDTTADKDLSIPGGQMTLQFFVYFFV